MLRQLSLICLLLVISSPAAGQLLVKQSSLYSPEFVQSIEAQVKDLDVPYAELTDDGRLLYEQGGDSYTFVLPAMNSPSEYRYSHVGLEYSLSMMSPRFGEYTYELRIKEKSNTERIYGRAVLKYSINGSEIDEDPYDKGLAYPVLEWSDEDLGIVLRIGTTDLGIEQVKVTKLHRDVGKALKLEDSPVLRRVK